MEKLYGIDSQVMNFHYLIHLADDVKYMLGPLSFFSSFPFESTLGKIKKLIRAPRNPLVQVLNRLEENWMHYQTILFYIDLILINAS